VAPDSGSGEGTPVPGGGVGGDTYFVPWCVGAVNLAEYQRLINHPLNAFWGVRHEAEIRGGCGIILLKEERDMIARYLCEAQDEIEQQTGYFLEPKWVTDEDHAYEGLIVLARQRKVITGGVRGEDMLDEDATIDHSADPAIVGPIAVTFTDTAEVKVYYPNAGQEIIPERVTITGGQLVIEIPRCRLVDPEYLNNDREGVEYTDLGNFLTVVDVMRVYNDPSTHAQLVRPGACVDGCGEEADDGCIYVKRPEIGSVTVRRATYSDGVWSAVSAGLCNRGYGLVRLNYLSGMDPTSPQAEDAIIRLAHSKMPEEPCGCSVAQRLWKRDRSVPSLLTAERLNCPFGLSDGAWIAWKFAMALKKYRAHTL